MLASFINMTKHMALQLPWLSNEVNRVDQPISIEYKMVHDFNQAMFRNFKFEHFPILNFLILWLSLRGSRGCYIDWEKLDYLL